MRVSFDFDGTLDDDFDGSFNDQKKEIQSLAKMYVETGNQVCIITKRYGPNYSNRGKKNEHVIVFELAKKLGIENVHFTNREMKFSYILNLKIDMHFENSDYEVNLIKDACRYSNHRCIVVPVESSDWRNYIL